MLKMEINKTDAKTRGFGDFGITILDDVMVAMSDGIKLSAKFWFPSTKASSLIQNARKSRVYFKPDKEATEKTFATIVEYLPYRKNDYTAERDHLRHPWMASHGYVIMRVDMRGSGQLVAPVLVCIFWVIIGVSPLQATRRVCIMVNTWSRNSWTVWKFFRGLRSRVGQTGK